MLETELALYSSAVSKAALWAVAQNSIRHLVDADDHFKKQRYASALASAVLSIEETGKLHFLAFTGKLFDKQRHKAHQLIFVTALTLLVELPKAAPWQPLLKEGLHADASLSAELQKVVGDNPELTQFVDALRGGAFSDPQERVAAWANAMNAKQMRDGSFETWRPLIDGLFHKLRMKATYVDVGPTGEVISGPSMIDVGSAEFLCLGALALLVLAFGFTIRAPLWDHRQEFVAVLSDDMTGMRTLMKYLQPLIDRAAKDQGRPVPLLDAIDSAVTRVNPTSSPATIG